MAMERVIKILNFRDYALTSRKKSVFYPLRCPCAGNPFCRNITREVYFFTFLRGHFMSKSIFVGNLPWSATEEQVQNLFARHGTVISVKLVSDRETGRGRGFGFVEMANAEADAAIQSLDSFRLDGRALRVNEAQPRAPRSPRY
jgi:hypothetical protein